MTDNPQDQPAEGGQQPYSGQPTPPPPPPPAQAPPPPAQAQPAPGYSQPAPGYGQQAPVSASDARMWAMFAHFGGIILTVIAPLVIYLMYKDRDPFIRRHATQALNFQIIIAIIMFVSIPLSFIGIGVLTFTAAWVALLVFSIIAGIAANKGEDYTYPAIPQMVT